MNGVVFEIIYRTIKFIKRFKKMHKNPILGKTIVKVNIDDDFHVNTMKMNSTNSLYITTYTI